MQGGKSFQDRELAAEVRSLTLNEIMKVLKGKDNEYKKALVLKMSTSILPRLNEIGGMGGVNLVIEVSGESAKRYGVTPNSKDSSS